MRQAHRADKAVRTRPCSKMIPVIREVAFGNEAVLPDTPHPFTDAKSKIPTIVFAHLCGNSIQFELDEQVKNEKAKQVFKAFRSGWLEKNMEVAWYEFAKSVKSTGDAAFVGFRHKGKFGWKILSYTTGSTLYPHYHPITGELDLFARAFTVDENGETINYMEAWDNRNMYLFREDSKAGSTTISTSEQIYSIDGYALQSVTTHSFPFIPVTYFRDENGPCWSPSQDTIEQYELAFSRMSQNNAAYAFPIMYFKGDNVEIQGSITRGTVTSVTMGKDDEAGFLNRQDVSSAFITQLDKLYKVIYEQSFAVIPPDLKSGDLPGVAVKLLYSPAYEKALTDAQEYQHSIEQMQTIFKEGYGTEIGMQREMTALRLNSWIKPYIHQNWTETITNMAMAVQNGFLSRKRANEVADEYATPQDWEQILSETKEEQQHDLLLQTQKQVNNVQTQE